MKILSTTILLAGLCTFVSAQSDTSVVKAFVKEKIQIKVTPLDQKTTETFFEGKLYSTKVSQNFGNGTSSQRGPVIYVLNGKARILSSELTTNQEMKSMVKAMKKGVVLASKDDALQFEKCLDLLFPISKLNATKYYMC